MNCDCLNKIDDKLREQNLKLSSYAFVMEELPLRLSARFVASTEWVNPDKAPRGQKRKPSYVVTPFCPFCGQLATSASLTPEPPTK